MLSDEELIEAVRNSTLGHKDLADAIGVSPRTLTRVKAGDIGSPVTRNRIREFVLAQSQHQGALQPILVPRELAVQIQSLVDLLQARSDATARTADMIRQAARTAPDAATPVKRQEARKAARRKPGPRPE